MTPLGCSLTYMLKKWLTPALLILLLGGMGYYYFNTQHPSGLVQHVAEETPAVKKSSKDSDGYLVSPTSKTGYTLQHIEILNRKEWKPFFVPTAPVGYTLSEKDVVVTFEDKKRKQIDQYRMLYKGANGSFSLETVAEVSEKKANEEQNVFYNSKEHILSFEHKGQAYIVRLSEGLQYESVRTWLSNNDI